MMLDQAIGRLDYQLLPRVCKPALLSPLLGDGQRPDLGEWQKLSLPTGSIFSFFKKSTEILISVHAL